MTDVLLCRLPQFDEKLKQQLLMLLPSARREEIGRIKNESKQWQRMVADCLLRAKICELTGVPLKQVELYRTADGQPKTPGYYVSISHSHEATAVAVSDSPIGIDIEKPRPFDLKAADRFFNSSEQEYISEEGTVSNARFFEVWTRKEAFVKRQGTGFKGKVCSVPTDSEDLKTLDLDGYVLSVCCKGDFTLVQIPGVENLIKHNENAPYEV